MSTLEVNLVLDGHEFTYSPWRYQLRYCPLEVTSALGRWCFPPKLLSTGASKPG